MDKEYFYSAPVAPTDDVALSVAGLAFIIVVLFITVVMFAISYAICSFLLGRIFKKAGIPQWIAWVPVYNVWKILELGGQQGFWALLGLLPFVGIISLIYVYIAMYYIGRRFGKEDWFVVLAIIVPVLWLGWLAFDDSKWHKQKKSTSLSTAKSATKAK
jgi:hypothetical protein